MRKLIIYLTLAIALSACTKHLESDLTLSTKGQATSLDSGYTSDHPYNLNVVLFVPNDMQLNPDYEDRISETLLYEQNYIADWMEKWGYGRKTFGLKKNAAGKVKINVVMGKLPTSSYPYNGGEPQMYSEIMEYFNTHTKDSDHFFVLTTVNEFGKQIAPFYGVRNGQWAYGIDFKDMKISNKKKPPFGTDTAAMASDWLGGNFHEMLHGLRLPHNGGLVSGNKLYGEPIITGNGGTFITGSSYLDAWDCALLSIGQTFSSTTRTDWYQDVSASLSNLKARFDEASQKIIVSGKFSANKNVLFIGFTNDAKRSSGDGNYDSENWVTTAIGTDSFYTELPIAELKDKRDFVNNFTISLFCENGSRPSFSYGYQMENGKPQIRFGEGHDNTGSLVDGGVYTFTSTDNNLSVLKVQNAQVGSKLVLDSTASGNNHKWLARNAGNNTYIFKSMLDTTKVLQVANTNNGTHVQLADGNNSTNQQWKLTSFATNVFNINTASRAGVGFATNGNSLNNGTIILLWSSPYASNQLFKVTRQ
jgi:hypothetical protein